MRDEQTTLVTAILYIADTFIGIITYHCFAFAVTIMHEIESCLFERSNIVHHRRFLAQFVKSSTKRTILKQDGISVNDLQRKRERKNESFYSVRQ